MRTALIVSAGTRGDLEPFLALLPPLLTHFDHIHLLLQPDYIPLITHPNTTTHPLPFTQKSVYNQFLLPHLKTFTLCYLLHLQPPTTAVRRDALALSKVLKKLIIPSLPPLFPLIDTLKPSLIIGCLLTATIGQTLAQHLNIPFALTAFHPNSRTSLYPFQLSDVHSAQSAAHHIANLQNTISTRLDTHAKSYDTMLNNLHKPSLSALNSTRKSFNLPPLTLSQIHSIYNATLPNVHVLNAYPTSLIPPDPLWPPTIHSVAPLAASYVPPDWNPTEQCPQLVNYLNQGPPPIAITFGSMVLFDKFTTVSRNLLSALRNLNIERAVIFKGSLDLGPHRLTRKDASLKKWAQDHVWVCEQRVQFAWLFPQCRAVICHGGAGTTFAALRAGVPIVIAPFCLDQFFWAKLVTDVGVGCAPETCLRDTTEGELVRCLKVALSEQVGGKVRSMGEELRGGDGPEIAARILGELVGGG